MSANLLNQARWLEQDRDTAAGAPLRTPQTGAHGLDQPHPAPLERLGHFLQIHVPAVRIRFAMSQPQFPS